MQVEEELVGCFDYCGGVSWFAHAGEEGREGEGGRNVLVKGGGRTVV